MKKCLESVSAAIDINGRPFCMDCGPQGGQRIRLTADWAPGIFMEQISLKLDFRGICFIMKLYSLKMRSAQTHFCAWAIMKKFIYACNENITLVGCLIYI